MNNFEHQLLLLDNFEVVERKGQGHPDTLADALGEELSIAYSKYTLEKFGVILHHNFDKVGLMGGCANVRFGGGIIEEPIRILLNGRASCSFDEEKIPVREIMEQVVFNFIKDKFPMLDVKKDIRLLYEVTTGSSPGRVENEKGYRHSWFTPKSISDLSELTFLACNDTSMGCSFAGHTITEKIVYELEYYLNSRTIKNKYPWIGNDIKIMAFSENDEKVNLTMAIPQISSYVQSMVEYKANVELLYSIITDFIANRWGRNIETSISINTRDKFVSNNIDVYLTYTGSSIEMGDEGFVGRGNRIGGLITPNRPYTMEGICGKNPVYHTGKMYSIASYEIAQQLKNKFNLDSNVFLIGQSGHSLARPWKTILQYNADIDKNIVEKIVYGVLDNFKYITERIISRQYILY
jgi:S-adenosylmethionine synthetase